MANVCIHLFAGQSNMVGMRSRRSLIGSDLCDRDVMYSYTTFFSGITSLGSDFTRNSNGWTTLRPIMSPDGAGWIEAQGRTEPWVCGLRGSWGYGPEMTFARCACKENTDQNKRIAAIKFAIGGTQLETGSQHWLPSSGVLYQAFVAEINARVTDIIANGDTVTFESFHWFQGESDISSSQAARRTAVESLIAAIRLETSTPNLKTILYDTTRPAFNALANQSIAANDTNVESIRTNDLNYFEDEIHLWGNSQAVLGKRAYDACA